VNRLRVARAQPVATIVAPAGYGKTTLLAQWAERDERPFAWVSIDERDDEPVVLLRHVAAALHRVVGLGPRTLKALRSPGESIWTAALPRVAQALATLDTAVVLVLDGASELCSGGSAEVVSALSDHVAAGSMLVLAGRSSPPVRSAALRASGRVLELGVGQLALSRRESELLVRATGVELGEERTGALLRKAEGWAAGLYLAVLALRDGGQRDTAALGGDDIYLADYFRSECLAGASPERLAFLRRTSVLQRLSGPVCDALLTRADSARELEAIERDGVMLVPLDHARASYRYHPLFRDALRHELELQEPEAVAALERRAADWFEVHGEAHLAIDHAAATGDLDRVARLVASLVLPAFDAGDVGAVERWLALFADEELLERYPQVAALGVWIHALRGRAAEAERWLAAAERAAASGAEGAGPAIAAARAALCGDGVEQMLADAEAAVAGLPLDSRWLPLALLLAGVACSLAGDGERAEIVLAAATDEAERLSDHGLLAAARAERAILPPRRDDVLGAEATALADQARGVPGDGAVGGLAQAVCARAQLRQGRWDDARIELASALRLGPRLTHALPWLAVQVHLELARAHVTLRDADAARRELGRAREILRRRPRLGTLRSEVDELAGDVDAMLTSRATRESGLTGAELRLLPLLTTHLSFREIGERLYVSRNTVKTQAISVYRKLGATSRSEAIAKAEALGLVDASAGAAHETSSSPDDAPA
jgi:LuxR family maltose regulon positive regulatory protein